MSLGGDLQMYFRYVLGLPAYLRESPLTLEQATATLQRRLEEREGNFLRVMERGVYGRPQSIYLRLLRHAGCEWTDLRDMVRTQGLEKTLHALHDAGVYIDFEEFKGRKPVVRGDLTIRADASDFDNPFPRAGYYSSSGGSTGAGTRVTTDLNSFRDRAPNTMLTLHVHNVLHVPRALWRAQLPETVALENILTAHRYRDVPRKWFTPISSAAFRTDIKHHVASAYTTAMARLCGLHIPTPEHVSIDRAIIIARWMVEKVKREGICLLNAPIARLMRVCLAAEEAGLDLRGTTMMGADEPPTPGKVQVITRTGARYVANYWFAEGGPLGTQCPDPLEPNDIHFYADSNAIIQSPQCVPGTDRIVDAFCFTSLLPSSPKLLLNVAIDDYGIVEERNCGCPLQHLGFTTHLRRIQSAAKLTGEGVTLVGSDMVRVLHEVLPRRFGGSPLDYQLAEEEDDDGFTRLNLVVSPRVSIHDEAVLLQCVYEALRNSNAMADNAQAHWADAEAMRVVRCEPYVTPRGKQPTLHVARRTNPA